MTDPDPGCGWSDQASSWIAGRLLPARKIITFPRRCGRWFDV